MPTKRWLYDEARHCGVDYSDAAQVAAYDANHRRLRDYDEEGRAIMNAIRLAPDDTVIDMACGTGAFALRAAPHCAHVYAVDISQPMLDYAAAQARRGGLTNIEFHHAGFLTYVHKGPLADCLVSSAALHHLPDFWKAVALKRLAAMLRPGGRFYLFDVVFSFEVAEFEQRLDAWLRAIAEKAGEEFAREAEIHIRQEYSTFAHVMEWLLTTAGFVIRKSDYHDHFTAAYLCTTRAAP